MPAHVLEIADIDRHFPAMNVTRAMLRTAGKRTNDNRLVIERMQELWLKRLLCGCAKYRVFCSRIAGSW